MKKFAFLAFASLALVGAASPQSKPAPKGKAPAMICAVTKEKVDVAKATKDHMYADYKGRRYFFCCNGCPDEFKKNPAKYAKSPSIATPKK